MPRTMRASKANVCYHVINRGNRRTEVFHQGGDYAAFVGVVRQACARISIARFGVWPDAQPFSSGLVAVARRRPERVDAMVADGACSALTALVPHERPRLAGTLSGLPDPRGRASVDGAALCRAECVACEFGCAGRRVALVELTVVGSARFDAFLASRPGAARCRLAGVRQCTANRGRTGAPAPQRQARDAFWFGSLDSGDRTAAGPGVEPARTGAATAELPDRGRESTFPGVRRDACCFQKRIHNELNRSAVVFQLTSLPDPACVLFLGGV